MHTYLVGGAVRDQCLGLPVTERDWVVVGATPAHMLANKFQPVGKDFPVFLHPKTHEEYALAHHHHSQSNSFSDLAKPMANSSPKYTFSLKVMYGSLPKLTKCSQG